MEALAFLHLLTLLLLDLLQAGQLLSSHLG